MGGCEILHHQKDGWSPINGYFTINSWWLYVIMIVLTCFNHIIHGIIHGMCFLVGCFFATVFNCYGAIPYQGPLSIIVHVQVLKESERSRTKSVFFHQVKPTENWVGLSWTKQSIVLSTNGSPNISAKICWNTFVGACAVFFVIVADPQCYNMLPQQCIWPHQYLSDHRTWGMVLSENVVLHPPISTGLVASVSHLRPKGGYFDVSQNVIKCYTLW